MPEVPRTDSIPELSLDKLNNLYSILGQVLDGIWFLETERRIGFEKALEIDLAVWKIFAVNETRRIISTLLANPEDRTKFSIEMIFTLLERILKTSLFNQSIQYQIERSDSERTFIFRVIECKTLKGMEKVGRPLHQVQQICKDIGLAYYENMAEVVHPDLKIECITIPSSYQFADDSPRCAWKFFFK